MWSASRQKEIIELRSEFNIIQRQHKEIQKNWGDSLSKKRQTFMQTK